MHKETIQNRKIIPYCQHPQMSLSEYGITYCALQASDDTPVIDPAFCRRLLETLCYFYTFTAKPTSKGALATAFWKCQSLSESTEAERAHKQFGRIIRSLCVLLLMCQERSTTRC